MTNPRLPQVALPAELLRGCRLMTDFRDALSMARDGWTLFNSPTFSPAYMGGGMNLNGTNQYATRPLTGELNSPELTFHLEFNSPFAADVGVSRRMLDCTPADPGRCFIYFAGDGRISIQLGGTTVLTSAAGATIAAWRTNQRNVLSVSGVSGTNIMWLNGVQIASSATAWLGGSVTMLYFGSSTIPSGFFAARYGRLYIGHHTSDLAEHTAYWENSMFSWRNRATYWLPLDGANHDPANHRTNSAIGSTYVSLGDGAGSNEPTKITSGRGIGYEFDGVNDQISDVPTLPMGYSAVTVLDHTLYLERNSCGVLEWMSTAGSFAGDWKYFAIIPTPNQTQVADLVHDLRQRGISTWNADDVIAPNYTTLLINDQSTLATTNIQAFRGTAGASVTIHWGDGDTTNAVCDGADHAYSHDYASTGTYTIGVSGDIDEIQKWYGYSQSFLSGNISNFAPLTNLTYLYLYYTAVTGDIADLAPLTNLTYLNLSYTAVTGDIADLAPLTSLTRLYFHYTSVTGDIADLAPLTNLTCLYLYYTAVTGDIADLAPLTSLTYLNLGSTTVTYSTMTQPAGWKTCNIYAYDMLPAGWSTAMVDQMLIDHDAIAVGGYSSTLKIDGTNDAHTNPGAAETARVSLVAKGKTVEVN